MLKPLSLMSMVFGDKGFERYFRLNEIIRMRRKLDRTSVPIGEGNGTPLQYSCLENPMDGGAW